MAKNHRKLTPKLLTATGIAVYFDVMRNQLSLRLLLDLGLPRGSLSRFVVGM